ncbi:hypothetical protein [Kineosporia succinea]|uniref:DUF2568 domain-containing protein n=1 Tax=Kineosporia succinea TaxID=84632 RepID=A0ABT9NY54_9ACTN|nr:hypothetical protein [Kineosporia succinea]MDP9825340.1 hypothetical protein [Kineosporia succinea]
MASRSLPLTLGGKIVAATGILYLLDSFAPWHRNCFGLFGTQVCDSEMAWGTPFSALSMLLVLALVAEVVVVQVFRVRPPMLGDLAAAWLRLGLAGTATALVVLQLVVGHERMGPSYGIAVGLALVIALTYGSYLRGVEAENGAAVPVPVGAAPLR